MEALERFLRFGDEDPRGWLNLRKDCRGKDIPKSCIFTELLEEGLKSGEGSQKRRFQTGGVGVCVWLTKKKIPLGVGGDSLI